MYAVIEAGGSQHKVEEGNMLTIDRLSVDGKEVQAGEEVSFEKVLLVSKDGTTTIGEPYVDGVKVKGTVEKVFKGEKVERYRYNRRHRFRKTVGFRARLTTVKIESIG
jgi:large subunit ribosomal protein L21